MIEGVSSKRTHPLLGYWFLGDRYISREFCKRGKGIK